MFHQGNPAESYLYRVIVLRGKNEVLDGSPAKDKDRVKALVDMYFEKWATELENGDVKIVVESY